VGTLGLAEPLLRKIYHGSPPPFVPDGDLAADRKCLAQLGVDGEYVFTSGSLLPYRRTEDVIQAFCDSVALAHPQAKLVIAGSGTDRRYGKVLQNTIAASGCADRVLVLNQVSQDIMRILYRRCRYFVAATEIEACPNTLLEAMASGSPILYADTPPLPEMLGHAGLSFRPRDIRDLGEKMQQLWTRDSTLSALREASIVRAANFSWSQCADSTFDALVNW
jgi:glycosyltransferase involved in cell wall biosynthesis